MEKEVKKNCYYCHLDKVNSEMQEIGEEGEERDVRNGWVNALRWTLKEGEGK